MRLPLGHHSGANFRPDVRVVRAIGPRADRAQGVHLGRPLRHADRAPQRLPLGAERAGRGHGVHQVSAKFDLSSFA